MMKESEEPELFDMEVVCENTEEQSNDAQSIDTQFSDKVLSSSNKSPDKNFKQIIYIEEDSSDVDSSDSDCERVAGIRQKSTMQKITIENVGQEKVFLKRRLDYPTHGQSNEIINVKYSNVSSKLSTNLVELNKLLNHVTMHAPSTDITDGSEVVQNNTEQSLVSKNDFTISEIAAQQIKSMVSSPVIKKNILIQSDSTYYPSAFKLGLIYLSEVQSVEETASLFKINEKVLEDWVKLQSEIQEQFVKDNFSEWEQDLFLAVILELSKRESITLKNVIDKRKASQPDSVNAEDSSMIHWAVDWCKQFRFQLDEIQEISENTTLRLPGFCKLPLEDQTYRSSCEKGYYPLSYKQEVMGYADLNSVEDSARKYKLLPSTIQHWISQRGMMGKPSQFISFKTNKNSSSTLNKYESLEIQLLQWHRLMERKGKAPSPNLLISKAMSLAKELNFTDFNASPKWFDDWSRKYLKADELSLDKNDKKNKDENVKSTLTLKDEWKKLSDRCEISGSSSELRLDADHSKYQLQTSNLEQRMLLLSCSDETDPSLSINSKTCDHTTETKSKNENYPASLSHSKSQNLSSEDNNKDAVKYANENGVEAASQYFGVTEDIIRHWCWTEKYFGNQDEESSIGSTSSNTNNTNSSLSSKSIESLSGSFQQIFLKFARDDWNANEHKVSTNDSCEASTPLPSALSEKINSSSQSLNKSPNVKVQSNYGLRAKAAIVNYLSMQEAKFSSISNKDTSSPIQVASPQVLTPEVTNVSQKLSYSSAAGTSKTKNQFSKDRICNNRMPTQETMRNFKGPWKKKCSTKSSVKLLESEPIILEPEPKDIEASPLTYPACFQARVIGCSEIKGLEATSQEFGLSKTVVNDWIHFKSSIKMLSQVENFEEWELDLYILVNKLYLKGVTLSLSEVVSKGKSILDSLNLSDIFLFEKEQATDWCERFGINTSDCTPFQSPPQKKEFSTETMHHRQKHSNEFISEVCEYVKENSSIKAHKKFGIPISTIRNWIVKRLAFKKPSESSLRILPPPQILEKAVNHSSSTNQSKVIRSSSFHGNSKYTNHLYLSKNKIKRPVGRPKHSDIHSLEKDKMKPKNPVGRPKKLPERTKIMKRPVGRPKLDNSTILGERKILVKNPVGRPKMSNNAYLTFRKKFFTGSKNTVGKYSDGVKLPGSTMKRPVGRPKRDNSVTLREGKTPAKNADFEGQVKEMSNVDSALSSEHHSKVGMTQSSTSQVPRSLTDVTMSTKKCVGRPKRQCTDSELNRENSQQMLEVSGPQKSMAATKNITRKLRKSGSKYSDDFKRQVVQYARLKGLREAHKYFKLSDSVIRSWGGSRKTSLSKYSAEVRSQTLAYSDLFGSLVACKKFKVSHSMLSSWITQRRLGSCSTDVLQPNQNTSQVKKTKQNAKVKDRVLPVKDSRREKRLSLDESLNVEEENLESNDDSINNHHGIIPVSKMNKESVPNALKCTKSVPFTKMSDSLKSSSMVLQKFKSNLAASPTVYNSVDFKRETLACYDQFGSAIASKKFNVSASMLSSWITQRGIESCSVDVPQPEQNTSKVEESKQNSKAEHQVLPVKDSKSEKKLSLDKQLNVEEENLKTIDYATNNQHGILPTSKMIKESVPSTLTRTKSVPLTKMSDSLKSSNILLPKKKSNFVGSPTVYPDKFKKEVVAYANRTDIVSASNHYSLPRTNVVRWIQKSKKRLLKKVKAKKPPLKDVKTKDAKTLEEEVFIWYQSVKLNDNFVRATKVIATAKAIAMKMNLTDLDLDQKWYKAWAHKYLVTSEPTSTLHDSMSDCSSSLKRAEVILVAAKKDLQDSPKSPNSSSGSTPTATDGSLNVDEIHLECRSIRIGSYKVRAQENQLLLVKVTCTEIHFHVTNFLGDKLVEVSLKQNDISLVLANFGKALPVLFIYTTPLCGENIRRLFNMTKKDNLYFDSCHSNESMKRITILPVCLSHHQQNFLLNKFPADLIQEIGPTMANEVLIKSTPIFHLEKSSSLQEQEQKRFKVGEDQDNNSVERPREENMDLEEKSNSSTLESQTKTSDSSLATSMKNNNNTINNTSNLPKKGELDNHSDLPHSDVSESNCSLENHSEISDSSGKKLYKSSLECSCCKSHGKKTMSNDSNSTPSCKRMRNEQGEIKNMENSLTRNSQFTRRVSQKLCRFCSSDHTHKASRMFKSQNSTVLRNTHLENVEAIQVDETFRASSMSKKDSPDNMTCKDTLLSVASVEGKGASSAANQSFRGIRTCKSIFRNSPKPKNDCLVLLSSAKGDPPVKANTPKKNPPVKTETPKKASPIKMNIPNKVTPIKEDTPKIDLLVPSTIVVITDPGTVFYHWLLEVNTNLQVLTPFSVIEKLSDIVKRTHEDYVDNWLFRLYIEEVKFIDHPITNFANLKSILGLEGYVAAEVKLEMISYMERRSINEALNCFQISTKSLNEWKESKNLLKKSLRISNLFRTNSRHAHADLNIYEWYSQSGKFDEESLKVKAIEIYREHNKNLNRSYKTFSEKFLRVICYETIENAVLTRILEKFDCNINILQEEVTNLYEMLLEQYKVKAMFLTSEEWYQQFCERYSYFLVQKLNLNDPLPDELEVHIKTFRESLLQMQFDLNCIGSMDEIPFSFDSSANDNCALRNCNLKHFDGVVLLSCLANGKVFPPFVVFKLASKKNKPHPLEIDINDSVVMQWLQRVWVPNLPEGKSVLILDSFAPHTTSKFTELAEKLKVTLAVVPPGCNSKVHPIASGLGHRFEQLFRTMRQKSEPCERPVLDKQQVISLVNDVHSKLSKEGEFVKRCFEVTSVIPTQNSLIENVCYLFENESS